MFALAGAGARTNPLIRPIRRLREAFRGRSARRWRRIETVSGTELVARGETPGWGRLTAFGWYELETELFFRHVLHPGAIVLDVGANEGVLTVVAAKLVGRTGRIIAFEPDRDAVNALKTAVTRNRLGNVTVEPVAVGAESGTLAVAQEQGDDYAKVVPTGAQVPCVALGDYCAEHGIERVDLVKVDVDGPELHVLHGLGPLLAGEQKPMLVIELSSETQRLGYDWSEILSFVRSLGYHTYASRMKFARVLPVTGPEDFDGLPVRFDRGEVANLFCTPRQLSDREREAAWPPSFLPSAYFTHYLSEEPFETPQAFWKSFQKELLTLRSPKRRSA